MAYTNKTRIGYDDDGGISKTMDQRKNERSTGGLAGTERARAQKPVKGVTNANTVDQSMSEKVTRPVTGGRK